MEYNRNCRFALLGIGVLWGLEGMIAGAIISGAYFGDKMSPLSDTTTCSSYGRYRAFYTYSVQMYTTIPTLIITLIIFLFLGLS